ncbi:MAG: hypothetical protein WDZ63_17450 [Burkholderiales bacterium]
MYNLLWFADNALAIISGCKLGDAYFNVLDKSNFADFDLPAGGRRLQFGVAREALKAEVAEGAGEKRWALK